MVQLRSPQVFTDFTQFQVKICVHLCAQLAPICVLFFFFRQAANSLCSLWQLAKTIVEWVFVAGMHGGISGTAASFRAGQDIAQGKDDLHDSYQSENHDEL